jgi:hypothetical protein
MDKDHLKLKNKIRFAKCDLIFNFVLEDLLVGAKNTPNGTVKMPPCTLLLDEDLRKNAV